MTDSMWLRLQMHSQSIHVDPSNVGSTTAHVGDSRPPTAPRRTSNRRGKRHESLAVHSNDQSIHDDDVPGSEISVQASNVSTANAHLDDFPLSNEPGHYIQESSSGQLIVSKERSLEFYRYEECKGATEMAVYSSINESYIGAIKVCPGTEGGVARSQRDEFYFVRSGRLYVTLDASRTLLRQGDVFVVTEQTCFALDNPFSHEAVLVFVLPANKFG